MAVLKEPGPMTGLIGTPPISHLTDQRSKEHLSRDRWNPMLWANHGYGVIMIDFHGSVGYGQPFTDSILGTLLIPGW